MQKYEIVNALIAKNGYSKYLEICTPSTGLRFSRIDPTPLLWRHRLVYRCPASFTDGSEISFRSNDEEIAHLLDSTLPYDIVFVDAYHTFDCSLRDLQSALSMLRPGGAIVVHDCCPKDQKLCNPSFRPGAWFGVTYCAYIDFVLSHADLVYYTVDADCGCGVIKRSAPGQTGPSPRAGNHELARLWFEEKNRNRDMFHFFRQHHRELLNLISVKDFLAVESVVLPRLSQWRETVATLLHT